MAEIDMDLVGELTDWRDLASVAVRTAADIIICSSLHAELPEGCERVLRDLPRVKALAIAEDGRQAALYQWHVRKEVLGEMGPHRVVEEIRRTLEEHLESNDVG